MRKVNLIDGKRDRWNQGLTEEFDCENGKLTSHTLPDFGHLPDFEPVTSWKPTCTKTCKDQSVTNTHRFALYANITRPRNYPGPRIQPIIIVHSTTEIVSTSYSPNP